MAETKEKKANWFEPLAFVLLLLLAVNVLLKIVPSYIYLEIAVLVVAVALEIYGRFVYDPQK